MNGTPAQRMEWLEPRTLLSITGLPIRIGSSGFDMGKRVAATPDGGYIDAGLFEGTVDFGTGGVHHRLSALGDTDIFVAKYNSASQLVWVERFGGTEYTDEISKHDVIDIAADPNRAGGNFVNGFGTDPILAAEYINDLKVSADGSIFLAGSFTGTVDFDPGKGVKIFRTFDNNYQDAFVLKLNSDGSLNWADRFGDRFTDTANALAFDSAGNIFVTGVFTRTVNFVPGKLKFTRNALGRADGYLLKLNSAGAVQWVNQFGADGTKKPLRDAGNALAVDSHNDVYVVGTYAGDATFTSTSGARTIVTGDKDTDGFIAKYDNNGKLVRTATYAASGYDGISSIAIDSSNNVVIAGYFQGDEFDADPGPGVRRLIAAPDIDGHRTDFTDLFIEKLSLNLRLQWVRQLAGTGTEFADQVRIDSHNNIVVGGSFYGLAKFGAKGPRIHSVPGSEGKGGFKDANDHDRADSYDAYLWKLDAAGTTKWVNTIGAASDDFGAGIDITSGDAILFTGRFRGTVDFQPTRARRQLTGDYFDAFVTGYKADGTTLF